MINVLRNNKVTYLDGYNFSCNCNSWEHRMASWRRKPESHPFLIIVNGKLVREESTAIDPAWSLAYYLREHLSLSGTKVGCGQGGCGACTVLISRYYKEDQESFRHYSVNACITPVASVHGCHVMTIENLGQKTTCHVIQDAIVKGNGTQCGFCTPGMVMSMLATSYNEPDFNLNIAQVKKSIQGNLCRCTGYRPLLEAVKNVSLCNSGGTGTSDIEDIARNSVEHPQTLEPQRTVLPHDMTELNKIEACIKKLFQEKPNSFLNVEFIGHKVHWIRPNSLIQLSSSLKKHPEANLVSGCTSTDYHPQRIHLKKEVIIQIDWMKELHSFEIYENHICVGGGITIAQLKQHLHVAIKTMPVWKRRSMKSILCILQRFGSPQIRNTATIGGCLSVENSASDLQTLANAFEFSALCFNPVSQAHIEIKSAFPSSLAKNVIVNVKIPFTMSNEYTWAYKLSRRRFFDTAIINIASKTLVQFPSDNEDAKIFRISLSFGGSAIKRFSLLFTYGTNPQDLTSELFLKLNNDIQREISSHLNTYMYSLTYISVLAKNLFKKFYEFLHDALHPSVASVHTDPDEMALNNLKATQTFATVKLEDQATTDLVWRPIPHASAYKFATGEAVYCDDIPKFRNELIMELVWSKRAHAFLKKVDPSLALKVDGVVGFISHKDLEKGKNLYGIIEKDEEIFASDKVYCVGQLIGAIVAVDALKAKKAAALVDIEYIDCHPRILTISDAIGHKSFYDKHSTTLRIGNVESVLESCEHVLADEIKLGGQIHFYLEPQSAIAIPKGEDGEMELIVATQNPSEVQALVAHTLGIISSKVVVRVKRVGGGFGGKDSRCALVALPSAIAANKYGKPVRCVLDRQTDIMISGKREPFLAKYEVGFDKDGRLLGVKMNIYSNAGTSLDTSGVPIERAVLNLDSAYKIPNLDVYGVPCKSNKPSNTVFRGPGRFQGISAHLNKDPADVRLLNMYNEGDYTPYGQLLENSTLRQCWNECLDSSCYYERKAEAVLYNSTHLYRKRGVYITPCHFGIGYIYLTLNQAGALVHIYQDGSVQISCGGVEIGQGLNSKMIQIATRELGIPAFKIRILETSTDKVPNGTPTSASLSSDMNGMAVANACIILKERVASYSKIIPKLSWEEIVEQAYQDRVNLSAVGFYKAPNLSWNATEKRGNPFSYFVSGAACSEVEVDCLTGEYQIRRTDIVMDCGKSLNPAIDLGQIEGAFMQGVGLFTLEEMVSDDFGNLLTTGTATYKIPTALDIPLEFNVSFLKGSSNPRAIYSSKSVGEPPLILANSVYFAIKDAVRQFRKQIGLDTRFKMDSPATVEKVLDACNDLYEPLVV